MLSFSCFFCSSLRRLSLFLSSFSSPFLSVRSFVLVKRNDSLVQFGSSKTSLPVAWKSKSSHSSHSSSSNTNPPASSSFSTSPLDKGSLARRPVSKRPANESTTSPTVPLSSLLSSSSSSAHRKSSADSPTFVSSGGVSSSCGFGSLFTAGSHNEDARRRSDLGGARRPHNRAPAAAVEAIAPSAPRLASASWSASAGALSVKTFEAGAQRGDDRNKTVFKDKEKPVHRSPGMKGRARHRSDGAPHPVPSLFGALGSGTTALAEADVKERAALDLKRFRTQAAQPSHPHRRARSGGD